MPVLVERPLEALVAKFIEKNESRLEGELSSTSYASTISANPSQSQLTECASSLAERVFDRHFTNLTVDANHSQRLSDSDLQSSDGSASAHSSELPCCTALGSPLNSSSVLTSRAPTNSSAPNTANECGPLPRVASAEANPPAGAGHDGRDITFDSSNDFLLNDLCSEDAFFLPVRPSECPPAPSAATFSPSKSQNPELHGSSSSDRAPSPRLALDAGSSPCSRSLFGRSARRVLSPPASSPTRTRSISRDSPERRVFERPPHAAPKSAGPLFSSSLTVTEPERTYNSNSDSNPNSNPNSNSTSDSDVKPPAAPTARTTIQLGTVPPPPPPRVSCRKRISRAVPSATRSSILSNLDAEHSAPHVSKTRKPRKPRSSLPAKPATTTTTSTTNDAPGEGAEPSTPTLKQRGRRKGFPNGFKKRKLDAILNELTATLVQNAQPLQSPSDSNTTEAVVRKASRISSSSDSDAAADSFGETSAWLLPATTITTTTTAVNVQSNQSVIPSAQAVAAPPTDLASTSTTSTVVASSQPQPQPPAPATNSQSKRTAAKSPAFVPPVSTVSKGPDPLVLGANRTRPTPAPSARPVARGASTTVARAAPPSLPLASSQTRKASVASASSAPLASSSSLSASPSLRVPSGTDMFVRRTGATSAFNPSANTLAQRSLSAWNAGRPTRPSPPSRSSGAAEALGDSASVYSDESDYYYSSAARPLSQDALSTLKCILLSRRGSSACASTNTTQMQMQMQRHASVSSTSPLLGSASNSAFASTARASLPISVKPTAPGGQTSPFGGPTKLPLMSPSISPLAAASGSRSPALPLLTHPKPSVSTDAASAQSAHTSQLSSQPVFLQTQPLLEQFSMASRSSTDSSSTLVSVGSSQLHLSDLSIQSLAPLLTAPAAPASAQIADVPQGFAYLLIPDPSSSSLPSGSSVSSMSSSLPSTPSCVPLEEPSSPAAATFECLPAPQQPQLAVESALPASSVGFLVASGASDAAMASAAGTSGQSSFNLSFSLSDIPDPSVFDIDAAFRLLEEI